MAKTSKLIEVKLSEGEICELINGLMVRGLGGNLGKDEKKLGKKLSDALRKHEKKNGKKA